MQALIALGLLVASATVGGAAARRVGLPPLLGMLLGGLVVGNLPGAPLAGLPDTWSVGLRLSALAIILLRAGLGLDLAALRRLPGPFLRLAFLPNLFEATTVAVVAMMLLELPLVWGLLLGFVVAAVSPAVVVPSLLDLQARGYGVKKGIPTVILAAASFDDVLSITGFGLTASLIFGAGAEGSLTTNLLRAPVELAGGLAVGLAAGWVCTRLGGGSSRLRVGLLLVFGLAAVFGGWRIGLAGGGGLATMTMGAVTARVWGDETIPVAATLARFWAVAQPFLFGLIGAAVALSVIEPGYIWSGLIILGVGLAVRLSVGFLSVAGGGFTTNERLFVALAWIPKATVQAAIGGLALDLARQGNEGADVIAYGNQVLTIAVLAIIVTAPIGALAIAWTGPRWLERSGATDR